MRQPDAGVVLVQWNPDGYLEKIPTDPGRGAYRYLSSGDRYVLKALGVDREEAGEGKYADLDSRDLYYIESSQLYPDGTLFGRFYRWLACYH